MLDFVVVSPDTLETTTEREPGAWVEGPQLPDIPGFLDRQTSFLTIEAGSPDRFIHIIAAQASRNT